MAPVTLSSLDQKLAMAKRCSHGNSLPLIKQGLYTISVANQSCFMCMHVSWAEGVIAGAKAAAVATVAAAVPTVSIHNSFELYLYVEFAYVW